MNKYYKSLRPRTRCGGSNLGKPLLPGLLRRSRRAPRNDINENGSAIFLVVLLLAGVLTISLGAADLIVSGAKMGKVQYDSTKAYFASEAGAERALWEVRKREIEPTNLLFEPEIDADCIANLSYVNFDNFNTPPGKAVCGAKQTNNLTNDSSYYVLFQDKDDVNKIITLKSFGDYRDTRRSVEITYSY